MSKIRRGLLVAVAVLAMVFGAAGCSSHHHHHHPKKYSGPSWY